MQKSSKIIVISLVALAIVYGVYQYAKKNTAKLAEMTYRFQNFKILNVSFRDFQSSIEVVLTNPSNLGFTVTGYNINVEIQNTRILNIADDSVNITIPSNQSVAIPLSIQFDPRKLSSTLLPLFLAVFLTGDSKEKIRIRYVGTASGRFGALGVKNIPIDYTYEM
jgi:LEA14-like dessication related protein